VRDLEKLNTALEGMALKRIELVERKDHLENLKRGFEYILDLLKIETEEWEKKLLN